MKILVLDIGGTHVKLLVSGEETPRRFPSGPNLTPDEMVTHVKNTVAGWDFDVASVGFPGPVRGGKIIAEPINLGPGWVGFDFDAALGVPVKLVNDAALQALGSSRGGKMLFLGLGTGLGTAMVIDGTPVPMELGHLPYRKTTFEDHVGRRGLDRLGKKKWRQRVEDVVQRLVAALQPDDIVIGGGNIKKLARLPDGVRAGDNANAFTGGFRLWDPAHEPIHANASIPAENVP